MSIMTPAAPGKKPVAARGELAVRELEDRLRETQQAVVRQRLTAGACWLATAFAVAVGAMAIVDYFVELALVWRMAWLVAALTAATIAAVRGWRRWIAPYTLSRAAADAEGHVKQFGQRLRTTLDYEHPQPRPAEASPSLLTALQNDTYQAVKKANWDAVVDGRPAFKAFAAAALVAFSWGVVLLLSGEFRIATGRALGLPFDYTSVNYSPQSSVVKIGEAVEVKAEVTGRPIESAQLRYRAAGSQDEWTTIDLLPEEVEETADVARRRSLLGELTTTLANLKRDLEFEVLAGPRALPPGAIQVLQPLTLEKTTAHVSPPSYTGKADQTVEALDLKVLEGSSVELQLELNRPAAEARLALLDGDRSIRPDTAGNGAGQARDFAFAIDGTFARVVLPDLRKSGTYTITAKAADGMLLDPQRLSIRAQLDRKPEVKFFQPPEELVVTPTTEVPMIVDARDDIGLHKVGIMYQVGAEETQTLWEQDAEGSDEPFTLSKVLELEELQVTYKDAITYYAFAEDSYFGQPRRTTTPLRYIDIRPFKMSFQVVEGGGSCNGCSVTLEELIFRQRQNLSLSFAAREQEPVATETFARLGTAQTELLEKTREFEEGMRERIGSISSLSLAVKNMQKAVDSLEGEQLSSAISAEQEALAELIATRENLRKVLSQSSSQSASACRKFDREQRQKLRMPEKKKQDQQQQLADLRKKIDDLAKRERQWSQSCSQCNSSSSSQSKSSSQKSQSQSQSQSSSQQASNSQKSEGSKREEQQDASSKDQGETSKNGEQQEGRPPSPAEVAAAQEKLRDELADLRERLEKLNTAGKAAGEQARQADESMKQGLEDLKKNDTEGAAKEGERSAQQLEQLSEHLAAMNARDFGQRLEQARQLAQQLATREEALEKKLGGGKSQGTKTQASPDSEDEEGAAGRKSDDSESGEQNSQGAAPSSQSGAANRENRLARDQRALAGQTDLLAEQLDALERDAATERGGAKAKLAQVQKENPPRDIAGLMRQAAADLESRRGDQAGRGATQARERLDELSRSLGDARADYAQPRLEELVALEEELARLLEQAKRAGENKGDVSAAKRKWDDLGQRLDNLAAGDKKLAEALHQMREGRARDDKSGNDSDRRAKADTDQSTGTTRPQPGDKLKPAPYVRNDGREMPEGHYSWLELGDFNGIREVTKVLQTRIQEAILAGALMDSDQPIPPEYRELVEKYYRALSDDLR
jgi:hypothetical protein